MNAGGKLALPLRHHTLTLPSKVPGQPPSSSEGITMLELNWATRGWRTLFKKA